MDNVLTAHDAYELTLKSDIFQLDVDLVFPILNVVKRVAMQGEFDCVISNTKDLTEKQRLYIIDRLEFFGYIVSLYSDNTLEVKWGIDDV